MKKVILLLLMFSFIGVSATPKELDVKKDNPISIVKSLDTDVSAALISANNVDIINFKIIKSLKESIMSKGNIGVAVKALKDGKLAKRSSWQSDKKFIFMQVPSIINSDIIPKMQSLPPDAKMAFIKTFNDPDEQIDAIYYSDQIAIVGLSNSIKAFSPSCEDILAEDWIVLN